MPRRHHKGRGHSGGEEAYFGSAWNPWEGTGHSEADTDYGLDFPEIIDYRLCPWCNGVYAIGLPCPDCGKLWLSDDDDG